MANTFWGVKVREKANKNLTFEFQFVNSINTATGKIFYALSNDVAWDTESLTYTELGDVTGHRNESQYNNFVYCDGNVFWKDVINKYIYVKFVGQIDGDSFSQISPITLGNRFQLYKQFTKSGQYAVLNASLLDANKDILSFSFIKRMEFRVKWYDGLIEKNEVRQITTSNEDYKNFLLGSENIAVKSFDSVIIDDNDEETKLSYTANLSYIITEPTQITFDTVKNIDIQGVHGSLMYNGYIYCSGRNSGEHNIAKISLSNPNDISYVDILFPDGSKMSTFDQIIEVNDFIYTMRNGFIIQINPQTLEWIRYRIDQAGQTGSGIPIVGDQNHIYILSNNLCVKIAAATLQNITSNDVNVIPLAESVLNVSNSVDLKGSLLHSAICDNTYLFAAYTTGNATNCVLVKINKITMVVEKAVDMPATTDDMTQNDDFIFLGQETDYPTFGYDFGAMGFRKSDLKIYPLGPLSNNDLESMTTYKAVTSYASLFFGDYLFDFKTNGNFYLIDTTIIDQWKLEIPGMATRRIFTYDYFGLNGVINDILFDFNTQTFHGFVWVGNGGSKSKYVTFSIPDLQIITKPVVEIGNYTEQNGSFEISGSITSNGGTLITDAHFEIFDLHNDQLIESIPISDFSIGVKVKTITTNVSIKYRLVASNSKGTSYSDFKTLTIATPPDVFVIKGIVYYGENTSSNVNINILDLESGSIVGSTQSDSNGQYTFSGLVEDKTYLIFGYKDNSRIIPKLKKPFKEI